MSRERDVTNDNNDWTLTVTSFIQLRRSHSQRRSWSWTDAPRHVFSLQRALLSSNLYSRRLILMDRIWRILGRLGIFPSYQSCFSTWWKAEWSVTLRHLSVYRRNPSTETAVLKIFSDIVLAIDSHDLSVLCLFDLSAAFDTVDHELLLSQLEITYGFTGQVLKWLRTYLFYLSSLF